MERFELYEGEQLPAMSPGYDSEEITLPRGPSYAEWCALRASASSTAPTQPATSFVPTPPTQPMETDRALKRAREEGNGDNPEDAELEALSRYARELYENQTRGEVIPETPENERPMDYTCMEEIVRLNTIKAVLEASIEALKETEFNQRVNLHSVAFRFHRRLFAPFKRIQAHAGCNSCQEALASVITNHVMATAAIHSEAQALVASVRENARKVRTFRPVHKPLCIFCEGSQCWCCDEDDEDDEDYTEEE